MKNFYKKAFSAFTLSMLAVSSISAAYTPQDGEALFSYAPAPITTAFDGGFGLGDAVGRFNVAIKLESKTFKGAKIRGVLVPLGDTDFLTGTSAWLSTSLNTSDDGMYTHTPDINIQLFEYEAENKNGNNKWGYAEVRFDKPYTIGDNDIYAGYTFTVIEENAGTANPIIITNKRSYTGRGLFVQTNGYAWKDVANMGYDWSSPMKVILELPETGVAIHPIETVFCTHGSVPKVPIDIFRTGLEKVNSIEYDVTLDGQTNSYSHTISNDSHLRNSDIITYPAYSFYADMPTVYDSGVHNLRINVTGVNGKDNNSPRAIANTKIQVTDFAPVKIPVVEERTCTGCGYCTSGYYALDVMNRLHKESDDFIGIVFHNSDQKGGEPMHTLAEMPFGSSNPTIMIDRVLDSSAYYSANISTTKTVGVEEAWQERAKVSAPAALEISAAWKDDQKEELEVTAKARFALDYKDADFRLDLCLLHDGMKGNSSEWWQSNYYNGVSNFASEPEWEKIYKGGSPIKGLVFNDVFIAAASEKFKGVENSVPSNIKQGDPIELKHTFKMSELKNLSGNPVIQNKNALRVAAVLFDKNGSILNGAKNLVPGYDESVGIESIENGNIAETVEYFDLTGRRVQSPSNGIYIIRYSDGHTEKKVIRN